MIFIFDVYFKINLIQNFSTKTNFTFWHILLKEAQPRIFKDKNISASFINTSSKSSKSKGRDEKSFLLSTKKNAVNNVVHPAFSLRSTLTKQRICIFRFWSNEKKFICQNFEFFRYFWHKNLKQFWCQFSSYVGHETGNIHLTWTF